MKNRKYCFRPLIRGFFFYAQTVAKAISGLVSVPSFGDSFFMVGPVGEEEGFKDVFPSPHSGILFL